MPRAACRLPETAGREQRGGQQRAERDDDPEPGRVVVGLRRRLLRGCVVVGLLGRLRGRVVGRVLRGVRRRSRRLLGLRRRPLVDRLDDRSVDRVRAAGGGPERPRLGRLRLEEQRADAVGAVEHHVEVVDVGRARPDGELVVARVQKAVDRAGLRVLEDDRVVLAVLDEDRVHRAGLRERLVARDVRVEPERDAVLAVEVDGGVELVADVVRVTDDDRRLVDAGASRRHPG